MKKIGAGDKAKVAGERRKRDLLLAKQRAPAEVQTFTIDHFVQGVVEWDMFGEIHAEANGKRLVSWGGDNDEGGRVGVADGGGSGRWWW